jgi:two-component system, OmpR family, sensor kinase
MDTARGLPIAAYLGALVALALASAFVAMLAIIIWLPPKPPDVMRADEVAEHFQAGYDYMLVENRLLPGDSMIWSVSRTPTIEEIEDSPHMELARVRLAHGLDLKPDQVRIAAAHVRRNDAFVFQVRDVEDLRREVEEAARDMEEAIREAEGETRAAEEALREVEQQRRAAEEAVREAEAASRVAMRAGHEDETLLETEEAAREAAEAARQAEDEARAAEREARAIERRLRVEKVRIRAGDVDVRVEVDPEVDVDVDSEGRVRVHRFEFNVAAHERGEAPAAPTQPDPPAARDAPSPRARVAPVAVPDPPSPPAAPLPPIFAPAPEGVMLISGFAIGAQLPDGRWLVMRQGRNWAEFGWIMRAALIIGGALAVLSLLAVLFARRLTRPIRSFADAVQAVGVNPQSEPVREEGPRELQSAARAVNTMQARLRALIADRTKTLAAVAHDMRTPLMRLRLVAENTAPEQRDRMAKEIEEVEALVASFIAFARDDPAEEARVRLDLSALLQSIADDQAEAGKSVSFAGEERLIVTGQSLGLKRLFANLVENALKYGGVARISMKREPGLIVVDVADNGPGVPPEQRESVFEPFVRLDNGEQRSGAGLGLPAARSIARAHGGDIVILDAEAGALVRVTLPG